MLSSDAFLYGRRGQIAALAARYAVPAIYDGRDYVDAGGLVSYGADFLNVMQLAECWPHSERRKACRSAGHAPGKFELVINLKAVKALDLMCLLALADDVIE